MFINLEIDLISIYYRALNDQLHSVVVAIKKSREDGVVRSINKFAGAVSTSLSIGLSSLSDVNISSNGTILPMLPNSFDLSMAIRTTFMENNGRALLNQSNKILSARFQIHML